MLAAVSNKDFVGEAIGLDEATAVEASIAAATVCALNGARILRMHEVRGVGARGPAWSRPSSACASPPTCGTT